MTTVNDFTDILRIIREQPEWADALRAALLGQDLLELPGRFEKFVETSDIRFSALESDVADLKAGQARLEGTVGRLEEGQARLEDTVGRLEEGQARLEDTVGRLEGTVGQLESTVGRLEGTVGRLDAAVSTLQGQVGNLLGSDYEIRLGKNIDTIIGQRLGIRGILLLKGSLLGNNTAYLDLMDSAEEQGDITEQERGDVNEADFILRGRSRSDQSTVYAAVEVSVTLGDSDINRAVARAGVLQKATGETSVPVVVSAHIDDARRRLAEERNVTLIPYGQ